jgi:PAS domain S-box-containing protein
MMVVNLTSDYEEIRRNSLIFDKILEISDDGFLIIDNESRIININKTYCQYLGVQKEDVLNKHVHELIKNSKLPEILKTKVTEIAVPHKLVQGQTHTDDKYVIVSRASVEDGDKVIAAVGQIKFSFHTMKLANDLKNLDDELNYYKTELARYIKDNFTFETIIGKSSSFQRVKETALKASRNDFTVLLTGETGTGKEVLANAIHYGSKRKNRPFIRVNCAAIPKELMESELFGYVDGAFTGAKQGGRKGKFELANHGTIFLDEIGEIPIYLQAKLLRALQEREIDALGSEKPTALDIRIIAATNKNLEEEVAAKRFRQDLYYRLNVINIIMPSLRERKEDIKLFINNHLKDLNKQYYTNCIITENAMRLLESYNWPGNIRELHNVISSLFNSVSGEVINENVLPYVFFQRGANPSGSKTDLTQMVEAYEKQLILQTLKDQDMSFSKAAKVLNIHRSTIYKKAEKYGIEI